MIGRRELLRRALGAGALLGLPSRMRAAAGVAPLIRRAIPATGEAVPVIGLGSAATFRTVAQGEDVDALRDVLAAMAERGASVFDTAPGYGASEAVAGRLARELDITKKLFWATKVNVAPRGGGAADPLAARAQIDESFRRIGVPAIDLIQVHNLGDVPVQLGILKELKAARRIRYLGVTTTNPEQYPALERLLGGERLDFIGVDYAVDNRAVERTILPLAADRGTAIMVYVPFGRTRLFRRVGGRSLPGWAAEFDATSWAQFFLKFVLGHPAVTVVTPATSQRRHLLDNLGGGTGRVPDAAMRERMADFVESLPSA